MLFVAPAVLGFLLWQFGPIVGSLFIAFTDWRLAGTPQWIGADNFQRIFGEDQLFRKSLGVTSYYSLVSVPLRMLFAFVLAVLLNQKIRALPIFRTIFYLPSIVPVIASSMLWLWLFSPDFGLLNTILRPLGFPKLQWVLAVAGGWGVVWWATGEQGCARAGVPGNSHGVRTRWRPASHGR